MRWVTSGLFLAFYYFAVAPSLAQDVIGVVKSIRGSADVFRGDKVIPLSEGDSILKGDIMRTKVASKVEIEFQDGNVIVLGELSKFEVERYDENKLLRLLRGWVRNVVSAIRARGIFELKTPNAILGVKGTDFLVFTNAFETNVIVFDGVVSFGSELGEILVSDGETSFVRLGGAPSTPTKVPKDTLMMIKREFMTHKEEGSEMRERGPLIRPEEIPEERTTEEEGIAAERMEEIKVLENTPPVSENPSLVEELSKTKVKVRVKIER